MRRVFYIVKEKQFGAHGRLYDIPQNIHTVFFSYTGVPAHTYKKNFKTCCAQPRVGSGDTAVLCSPETKLSNRSNAESRVQHISDSYSVRFFSPQITLCCTGIKPLKEARKYLIFQCRSWYQNRTTEQEKINLYLKYF